MFSKPKNACISVVVNVRVDTEGFTTLPLFSSGERQSEKNIRFYLLNQGISSAKTSFALEFPITI
jgi:hypothetical protein